MIICVCLAVFLYGCGAAAGDTERADIKRGTAIVRKGVTHRYKRQSPYRNDAVVVTPSEPSEKSEPANNRALLLAKRATNVPGVDKAGAVINDNMAIIGIEVRGELDDGALMRIKRAVETEARKADRGIEKVAVTASKEIVERLMERGAAAAPLSIR